MIDDQQRDAFHLCRRRETQDGLALPVRPEPIVGPALVADFPLGVEHLQQPFVPLRRGLTATLGFPDDLPGVVGSRQRHDHAGDARPAPSTDAARVRSIVPLITHIRVPRRAIPERPVWQARARRASAAQSITGMTSIAIVNGILVVEPDAGHILPNDLEHVVQIDGAEGQAQHHTEGPGADRFHPDRPPDLTPESAHGPQHAELAPAIRNRDRQRVHDSEDGHEHGHRHLDVRQLEPLIGQSQNILPQVVVVQDEHLTHAGELLEHAPPHVQRIRARRRHTP